MNETMREKIEEILQGTFDYGKDGKAPFVGLSKTYRVKQIEQLILTSQLAILDELEMDLQDLDKEVIDTEDMSSLVDRKQVTAKISQIRKRLESGE